MGGEKSFTSPASPALSRGVFIRLRTCHCDAVSALLKAIHLTFKPPNRLGPPADPSIPRLTYRQGAHFPGGWQRGDGTSCAQALLVPGFQQEFFFSRKA